MSEIEWLRNPDGSKGKTWNPISGCTPASTGCLNCYAAAVASRGMCDDHRGLTRKANRRNGDGKLVSLPVFNGTIRTHPDRLAIPLKWRKPQRVFVNSMSDLFHPDVPFEFIAAVFGVMAATPQHTYMVLTKRDPRPFFAWLDGQASVYDTILSHAATHLRGWAWSIALESAGLVQSLPECESWPLRNVHLGVSAEDQRTFDQRVPWLFECPADVRWVSAEPLLGPIDMLYGLDPRERDIDDHDEGSGFARTPPNGPQLDWVVVGGESGPGARSCAVEWIGEIVGQCLAERVPVFVKQLGRRSSHPVQDSKGGAPDEWPEGLRVRDYPNAHEPEDDTSERARCEWIADAAKHCRCCAVCCDSPCAATLAGGFCDATECTCGDGPEGQYEDDWQDGYCCNGSGWQPVGVDGDTYEACDTCNADGERPAPDEGWRDVHASARPDQSNPPPGYSVQEEEDNGDYSVFLVREDGRHYPCTRVDPDDATAAAWEHHDAIAGPAFERGREAGSKELGESRKRLLKLDAALASEHELRLKAETKLAKHQGLEGGRGGAWYWIGDGNDDLASLSHSSYVVIEAGDLRGLIGLADDESPRTPREPEQDRSQSPPGYGIEETESGCFYGSVPSGRNFGLKSEAILKLWEHHDAIANPAFERGRSFREVEIVQMLAGEFGEGEIGPTESLDDVVKHIRAWHKNTFSLLEEFSDLRMRLRAELQDALTDDEIVAAVQARGVAGGQVDDAEQDRSQPPPGYTTWECHPSEKENLPEWPWRWVSVGGNGNSNYARDRKDSVRAAWKHHDAIAKSAFLRGRSVREAGIVQLLAGEFGEGEVGPTESLDDVISHIHASHRIIFGVRGELSGLRMRLRAELQDARTDDEIVAAVQDAAAKAKRSDRLGVATDTGCDASYENATATEKQRETEDRSSVPPGYTIRRGGYEGAKWRIEPPYDAAADQEDEQRAIAECWEHYDAAAQRAAERELKTNGGVR